MSVWGVLKEFTIWLPNDKMPKAAGIINSFSLLIFFLAEEKKMILNWNHFSLVFSHFTLHTWRSSAEWGNYLKFMPAPLTYINFRMHSLIIWAKDSSLTENKYILRQTQQLKVSKKILKLSLVMIFIFLYVKLIRYVIPIFYCFFNLFSIEIKQFEKVIVISVCYWQ